MSGLTKPEQKPRRLSWLGDELPEEEPVALVLVNLPAGILTLDTTAGYELVIAERIPPGSLTVLCLDW